MIFSLALLGLAGAVARVEETAPRGRGCLVSDDGLVQDAARRSTLHASSRRQELPSNITVDVNFHIASTEENENLVTDEIVDAQWKVLHESFAKYNVNLVLNSTERVVDNLTGQAFLIYEGPDNGWVHYEEKEKEYFKSTRKGGYDALNLYFFSPYSPGATGSCSWPTVIEDGDDLTFGLDSCQLSALTMPGFTAGQGAFEDWNLGHLAVHEAGHWFGLNHTFAGGCSEPGDFVADTPAQLTQIYGCPVGSDSCPNNEGVDPIHNFMGYTNDNCTNEFTPGQKDRDKIDLESTSFQHSNLSESAQSQSTMPTFLIAGATGQQGGGVVEALLASGHPDLTIRALTRNPSSSAAQALERRGVQAVKGDLLDRESLVRAFEGVDAAYLVTDFRGPEDVEGELKQGRQYVDVAKDAGIKHLVFSSVAGADIAQAVEHFYTKYKIEEYIKASGLSWTAIRPVGFMEVIPPPGIGRFFFLSAMESLMGNTKQKYISCRDIGKAIAIALLNPEKYNGKVLTIAGQVADVDELQSALDKGEGTKSWGRIWLPRWVIIRLTPHHYRQMFDWLYHENCQPGSVEETRELIPDILSIEDWAKQNSQKAKDD
ncbi:hypothetical protein QQZ08_003688 [Neonectria magnoliae]|uniref:NmrA-like domain-containing protein n=1 Tax=Neonectria magnoliae TaxID=2732573 RepID=A0ABR1IAF9_9HYPO